MQKDWLVVVDSREKKPLPLPRHLTLLNDLYPPEQKSVRTVTIHQVKEPLPSGDYLLRGHEDRTIVERKGSLREVFQNCLSKDRQRFVDALGRLSESSDRPTLLVEADLPGLQRGVGGLSPNEVSAGFDSLLRTCGDLGVQLFVLPGRTLPQRRLAGEFLLRLLINGALSPCPKKLIGEP